MKTLIENYKIIFEAIKETQYGIYIIWGFKIAFAAFVLFLIYKFIKYCSLDNHSRFRKDKMAQKVMERRIELRIGIGKNFLERLEACQKNPILYCELCHKKYQEDKLEEYNQYIMYHPNLGEFTYTSYHSDNAANDLIFSSLDYLFNASIEKSDIKAAERLYKESTIDFLKYLKREKYEIIDDLNYILRSHDLKDIDPNLIDEYINNIENEINEEIDD